MRRRKQFVKYINLFPYFPILITSLFIFITNSPGNVWGANVYIDPTYSGTQLGTFDKPYNSWTDISWNDAVLFSATNDYRQKCGTSETLSGALPIAASGASNNHIIIGAYYNNAGSPVHEDDNPNFGQLCGNSAQKPILRRDANGTGAIADTANGGSQYLQFDSLQFQLAETGIYVQSNYNKVRYCYFYDIEWGVRIGQNTGDIDGDYNTIEYNYIDLNDAVDETHPDGDCIAIYQRGQSNIIQYNVCGGFDHGGINLFGADSNIIQYNYFFEGAIGSEDFCIGHNANADNNVIRYNFCEDAGQGHQIMGGNNNEIYGNIYTCNGSSHPEPGQGCIQFQSEAAMITSQNNKFYNNLIYDNDNISTNRGIFFYSGDTDNGDVSGNEIYNNVVLKMAEYCIRAYDNNNVIGTNYFKNNSCYNYKTNRYANIEGSISATASAVNSRAYAANNRDNDPGLKNPSVGQFWPEGVSADLVGNGYNLGLKYNKILDPEATNFKASPPVVKTKDQPANWVIGPYALPGGSQAIPPPSDLQITQ